MASIDVKVSKKLVSLIKKSLQEKLTEFIIPDVIERVITDFDNYFSQFDISPRSNFKLEDIREIFYDRLIRFEYIDIDDSIDNVKFISPDMDNFNFNRELGVLKTIFDGISGDYVEIGISKYISIFGARPVGEALNDDLPEQEKVYLVSYKSFMSGNKIAVRNTLVKFPFSDTSPFDVFEETNYFVEENLDKWVDESIIEAESKLSKM